MFLIFSFLWLTGGYTFWLSGLRSEEVAEMITKTFDSKTEGAVFFLTMLPVCLLLGPFCWTSDYRKWSKARKKAFIEHKRQLRGLTKTEAKALKFRDGRWVIEGE